MVNARVLYVFALLVFVGLFVTFLVLYLTNSTASPTTSVASVAAAEAEDSSQAAVVPATAATRIPARMNEGDAGFVTVTLMGGLGNQLFQIAAAYAYGRRFRKTFVLDHSQKLLTTGVHRPTYFDSMCKWVKHDATMGRRNWREHTEKSFDYAELPNRFGNVRLSGYFQSEKYFADVGDDLAQLILDSAKPIPTGDLGANPIPAELAVVYDRDATPTVSLHVRRADYVGSAMHTVQDLGYYERAIQRVKDELFARMASQSDEVVGDGGRGGGLQVDATALVNGSVKLTVIVFSDDIPWCKQHLAFLPADSVFVEPGLADEQEMVLMSRCSHNIIANSSFSWWGAYLNRNPEKIVVAPSKWFNSPTTNWQDVYCAGWVVM